MRKKFIKHAFSIAIPQVMGAFISIINFITGTMMVKCASVLSFLGFVLIVSFWFYFFGSYPDNIGIKQKNILKLIYHSGRVVFILFSLASVLAIILSNPSVSFWLLIFFFCLESAEHFFFRLMDGNGKFFWEMKKSKNDGGAIRIALMKAERMN
ncbi:MAG: hypothetical protein N3F09_09030 [Bacteroidia bacterium]|nr:hypothetical protein [Bacteroidia bacterium]